MFAAANGRLDVVGALAAYEAGLRDKNGKTALMYAAEQGHIDCVKLLAEQEQGMKDAKEKTALCYCAQQECADFLWTIPGERDIGEMEDFIFQSAVPQLDCTARTCVGARNLLDAALLGCPQCCTRFLD